MKVNAMKLKQEIKLLEGEVNFSFDEDSQCESPIKAAELAKNSGEKLQALQNALEYLNGKVKTTFDGMELTISQLLKELAKTKKEEANASTIEKLLVDWKNSEKSNKAVREVLPEKRTIYMRETFVPDNLDEVQKNLPAVFGPSKKLKRKVLEIQNCVGHACTIALDVSSIAKAIGVETSFLENLLSDKD